MDQPSNLFVGGKSSVWCVDPVDGRIVWQSELRTGVFSRGNRFVTVADVNGQLFAFTGGSLYRLDKADGRILWERELPGMRHTLATLAIAGSTAAAAASLAQAAAVAATTAAAGGAAAATTSST
ncbi:MAG: PQQ-binding-like beta-propeller repeat protein [Planctomycetota bacterium]